MSRLTITWWTRAARQRTGGSGSSSVKPDTLLAGIALDHVHRRLDSGVEVDLVPFSFVDAGEQPQVLDDPFDPAQPLAGALDEPGQVIQRVVEVELPLTESICAVNAASPAGPRRSSCR